jgi:hypothetical protein
MAMGAVSEENRLRRAGRATIRGGLLQPASSNHKNLLQLDFAEADMATGVRIEKRIGIGVKVNFRYE